MYFTSAMADATASILTRRLKEPSPIRWTLSVYPDVGIALTFSTALHDEALCRLFGCNNTWMVEGTQETYPNPYRAVQAWLNTKETEHAT